LAVNAKIHGKTLSGAACDGTIDGKFSRSRLAMRRKAGKTAGAHPGKAAVLSAIIYAFSTTHGLDCAMSLISTDPAPLLPPGAVPNLDFTLDTSLGFERAQDGMQFRFAYGEIPATGQISLDGGTYRLSVRAVVGIVPYSIEDRHTRSDLLSGLGEITHASNGMVKVDSRQVIVVSAESRMTAPLTPLSVISEMVALMIRTRPYFETVGELLPEIKSALPARG
jgi:hypothetical protein